MLSLHFTMVPVPMNTELQVWVGSLGFKKKKQHPANVPIL